MEESIFAPCIDWESSHSSIYTLYLQKTIVAQAKTFTVSAWKSSQLVFQNRNRGRQEFCIQKNNHINAQNST